MRSGKMRATAAMIMPPEERCDSAENQSIIAPPSGRFSTDEETMKFGSAEMAQLMDEAKASIGHPSCHLVVTECFSSQLRSASNAGDIAVSDCLRTVRVPSSSIVIV
jgi:hypothetical protein